MDPIMYKGQRVGEYTLCSHVECSKVICAIPSLSVFTTINLITEILFNDHHFVLFLVCSSLGVKCGFNSFFSTDGIKETLEFSYQSF